MGYNEYFTIVLIMRGFFRYQMGLDVYVDWPN